MKQNILKLGNKYLPLIMLLVLPLLILLPLFATHQMHYRVDVWFNLMRIEEMSQAVRGGYFPSMGNVHTFGNAGQLVQGMYPSFTLGIFVAATAFLSAINQIYAIYYLILTAVGISYYFIFKKIKPTNWGAMICAIIMAYPTTFYFMLQGGQFGLSLAYIFLPLVFWGLYTIRGTETKNAYIYIGAGVGLILLSHMASGMFTIMMVGIVALADLVTKRNNFLEYVKSGIVAVLIGLPTLLKLGLMGSSIMGVAIRDTEAKMNILTMFSSLWKNGNAYFGVTAFMMIGFIYVIATVLKDTQAKSMKIAVIVLALMSTTTGYVIIFTSIQFPHRFMTYALQLALFIFLLELPKYYKKLGQSNVNLIYMLLVILALVPAANSVLSAREFVKQYPLWQKEQNYRRNFTKIDRATYDFDNFTNIRTYIDYLPVQQMKTAIKPPMMYVASKQMRDVNEAKSVRPTNFKSKEIKMTKSEKIESMDLKSSLDNKVIPYQPAKHIQAEKRTVTMDVNVNKTGHFDLPFWMYPHVKYTVKVDGKQVTPHISEQGRMSIPLVEGAHTVSITQNAPVLMIVAYMISIFTLLAGVIIGLRTKRTMSEKKV